eukprot:3732960-Amphidinium_carterae.1
MSKLAGNNVLHIRLLRRLAGKWSHISTIIPAVKPFVQPLWAALTSPGSSRAPANHIWFRQVAYSFSWLRAFLAESCGAMSR